MVSSSDPRSDPRNPGLDWRQVQHITLDSREVVPGSLFLALPGTQVDGARFAHQAAARGATAILLDADTPTGLIPQGPQILLSKTPLADGAALAAQFFAAAPDCAGAVTGTNGKTSVTWFAQHLLEAAQKPTVSLGTLGLRPAHLGSLPALTSPDPVSLHRSLKTACDQGFTHLVMEASSHGLDQHRLDGLRFDALAFTNLTQDHLDYHGDMEAYARAKLRLLDLKKPGGQTIANADDPVFGKLIASDLAGWSYGHQGKEGRILTLKPTSRGLHLKTADFDLELPLIGEFQASNLLCAWLMTRALGAETAEYLPRVQAIPGRMQAVAQHIHGGLVIVDYAHTPNALETVLSAARAHTPGKLFCVFGAGGNRDQAKRPLMGEAAHRLADHCLITDDNPRNEDPADIRRQIAAACPKALQIGDRESAIASALEQAGAGDLILIAGKGHETGQIIGEQSLAFDDREVARRLAQQTSHWQALP